MKLLFEGWRKFIINEGAKSEQDLINLDYHPEGEDIPTVWQLHFVDDAGYMKAAKQYGLETDPNFFRKSQEERGQMKLDIANKIGRMTPPKPIMIINDRGNDGFEVGFGALFWGRKGPSVMNFYSAKNQKRLMLKGSPISEFPAGSIEVKPANPYYGECLKGYITKMTYNTKKGWGPLLYDIAMEYATIRGSGLMSDRKSVSSHAEPIWNYYNKKRTDVEKQQMDINKKQADKYNIKQLTPKNTEDDCNQFSALSYAKGREYGEWDVLGPGNTLAPTVEPEMFKDVDSGWEDQAVSKMYSKDPEKINKLMSNHMIHAPQLGLDLPKIIMRLNRFKKGSGKIKFK